MSRFRIVGQVIELDHEPVATLRQPIRATLLARVVATLDGLPEDWWDIWPAMTEDDGDSRIVD